MDRTSEGEKVWKEYIANPAVSEATSLWHNAPNPLFGQAARAFDAEVFAAVSVLCRAACEAACYLFLTRTVEGHPEGTSRVYMPKTKRGKDVTTRFEDLIEEVRERGILSADQCLNLKRIKDHGDVIAHLGERTTKHVTRPLAHMDDVLWITEDEARSDLLDAADILSTMAHCIADHPEKMGPGRVLVEGMRSNQPLPHGGVEVLVDFITHQDMVTWTALSIFLAAEVILVGFLLQALLSSPASIGTVAAMGILITFVSLIVIRRSNRYLAAYFSLAQERCHPDDLPIFGVQPPSRISTGWALTILHVVFFTLWGAVTLAYFYVTYFRPR